VLPASQEVTSYTPEEEPFSVTCLAGGDQLHSGGGAVQCYLPRRRCRDKVLDRIWLRTRPTNENRGPYLERN
jgi:hypothetical protein